MGLRRRLSRLWDETTDGVLTGPGINVESVNTERLNNDTLYAEMFDGSDPESRLDNALQAVSDSQTIVLESAIYTDPITTSKKINVVSSGLAMVGDDNDAAAKPRIEADWTFNDSANVSGIRLVNASTLTLAGLKSRATHLTTKSFETSNVKIDGDVSLVTNLIRTNVTLNGNSCTVDASTGVSVTDNGSNNTVGDI